MCAGEPKPPSPCEIWCPPAGLGTELAWQGLQRPPGEKRPSQGVKFL